MSEAARLADSAAAFEETVNVAQAALLQPVLRSVNRPADALQQIVEVMRDAAGQMAHRFHLLGLAQRFLRRRQFGLGFLLR